VSSTSLTAPQSFTGISQYASDFQAVLTRAVQIAQIPVGQLTSKDANIIQQKSLLTTINGAVADLATSLASLGKVATGGALSATSSDPTAVTVSNSGATNATAYTIDSITSAAAAASERTTAGFTDSAATPVSNGTLTLVVGGQAQTFSLTSNNLNNLRDRINALGAGVTASIVTSGGSSSLAVTSNSGPQSQSILLFDGTSATGTDLLTSAATYADPFTTHVSNGTLTLQFGASTRTFSLAGNNLTTLRDQINGLGIGVTASILTTSDGNFLSVAANTTGQTTLKLFDGATATGTNLMTNSNQGTNAVFQLNGLHIVQAGNVVNSVVPGLTFTIQAASTAPVTLTVASDGTQISSGLQDFVTKYNALKQAVSAQVGPAAGLLLGDTVVNQLQGLLRQITSYGGAGSVQSLSDLGVQFSNTGVASFNQSVFNSLSDTQVASALTFLGSASSGLAGFSRNLTTFSDPITGLIKVEQDGIDRTDRSFQNQIATLNDRIALMQANLLSQLEAADAAQAQLQSQQTELGASLQGLSLVLYGKNLSQV
jgi:flagellar hook-associated protein 2